MGQRFTISSPTQVTAIGGDIGEVTPGGLFGVIVSLPSPNALPSGNPFDSTTVASVVFDAPFPSQDISIPLTVLLEPATYGLIFGSNEFGSFGFGFMGTNNIALPGADVFLWNQQHVPGLFMWTDSGGQPPGTFSPRFVVYGEVVPEPPPRVALIISLLALITFRRKLGVR